jgi:hypothetical protein
MCSIILRSAIAGNLGHAVLWDCGRLWDRGRLWDPASAGLRHRATHGEHADG